MSSTFYAAFRHVELDNIGYGKKRVLKPPGGGSSDIFGGEGGNLPQHRAVTQHHLKSSFFAEPPSVPTINGNSEINSNGTTNGTTNGHATTPKGLKNVARNPVTGEGMGGSQLTRSARKRAIGDPKEGSPPPPPPDYAPARATEGRNPVTGEGYIRGDERDSSNAMSAQPKQRVPPGGYTTPLW